MVARNYSNVAVATTLSAGINNSVTSLAVADATGWPSAPFTAVIDPDTVDEEIILVGAKAGTTFSTITRGYNGSSGKSHSGGAVIKHCVVATDFTELYTHDHKGDYQKVDHGDLLGLADDDHPHYFKAASHTKAAHDALGMDHGSLSGLADDDHTQYYNAARHTKAVHDALALHHGDLTGLADDDHTNYYNAARHTKAVHDALGINADTLDTKHAADLANAVHLHVLGSIGDVSVAGMAVYDAMVCQSTGASPQWKAERITAQRHIDDWEIATYTPALTASTTNPTLSDNLSHVTEGWYRRIGKLIQVEVFIRFGNSGVAAGSGGYRISLPRNSAAYGRTIPLGYGYVYDDSAGWRPQVMALYGAATYIILATNPASSGAGAVTQAAPFAWANNDVIAVHFEYEDNSY